MEPSWRAPASRSSHLKRVVGDPPEPLAGDCRRRLGEPDISPPNSCDFPPVNEPAAHLAVAIAGHDTARLKSERVQGRVHVAIEAHAATQPVKSDGLTVLPDALDLTELTSWLGLGLVSSLGLGLGLGLG